MRQTDRQTDVRQKHCLMPPPIRGGGIITYKAARGESQESRYLFWFRPQGWHTALQTLGGSRRWHSCLPDLGLRWTHGFLLPMHCAVPRVSADKYTDWKKTFFLITPNIIPSFRLKLALIRRLTWKIFLQCFDTAGWATGRASGL